MFEGLANGAGARLATSTSCVVAVHVATQCLSCWLIGLLAAKDIKRVYAATSTYCSLASPMMRISMVEIRPVLTGRSWNQLASQVIPLHTTPNPNYDCDSCGRRVLVISPQ